MNITIKRHAHMRTVLLATVSVVSLTLSGAAQAQVFAGNDFWWSIEGGLLSRDPGSTALNPVAAVAPIGGVSFATEFGMQGLDSPNSFSGGVSHSSTDAVPFYQYTTIPTFPGGYIIDEGSSSETMTTVDLEFGRDVGVGSFEGRATVGVRVLSYEARRTGTTTRYDAGYSTPGYNGPGFNLPGYFVPGFYGPYGPGFYGPYGPGFYGPYGPGYYGPFGPGIYIPGPYVPGPYYPGTNIPSSTTITGIERSVVFKGVGPRIGMEGSIPVAAKVSLDLDASLAVLIGKRTTTDSVDGLVVNVVTEDAAVTNISASAAVSYALSATSEVSLGYSGQYFQNLLDPLGSGHILNHGPFVKFSTKF